MTTNRVIPPHLTDPDGKHDSRYFRRSDPLPEGPPGKKGDRGLPGSGFTVLGRMDYSHQLPATGEVGQAWMVNYPTGAEVFGSGPYGVGPYGTGDPCMFVWSSSGWVNIGVVNPAPPAEGLILDGSGVAETAARSDHHHDGTYSPATHLHDERYALKAASYPPSVHTHHFGQITGSAVPSQIPNLSADKITTGVLADARIPALDASKVATGTFAAARIPALDASKITTGTLAREVIPGLYASSVVSGEFHANRIPSLNANKITAGTFALARIPTGTSGNDVALGNHKHALFGLFPWTHRMNSGTQLLRVGPSYDHAVIGTVEQGHSLSDLGVAPQSSGGNAWRYVLHALGFGWVPWVGVTAL